MSKINEKGQEVLDDRPLAIPVGWHRPPTLAETVARLVKTEVSRRAQNAGYETFQEADDFNVGDDLDPSSPYEEHFDHAVNLENDLRTLQEQKSKGKQTPASEPVSVAKPPSVPKEKVEEMVKKMAELEAEIKRLVL